jgi:hypothetical protein
VRQFAQTGTAPCQRSCCIHPPVPRAVQQEISPRHLRGSFPHRLTAAAGLLNRLSLPGQLLSTGPNLPSLLRAGSTLLLLPVALLGLALVVRGLYAGVMVDGALLLVLEAP